MMRAQLMVGMGGGEERLRSFKCFGFRWGGGFRSPTNCYHEEMNYPFSRWRGLLESFFLSSLREKDEITGWPITRVAARTLLWNSDYYLQCVTSSAEPSNPGACGWSCGMLLTSVIWRDPSSTATWLARETIHRGHGWSGEALNIDLHNVDMLFLFLND